jgi:hypothetical protein
MTLSHHYVAGLWRQAGLKPHRQGTFKISKDPLLAEKVTDIITLCVDPPGGAVVLSIDEKMRAPRGADGAVRDGRPAAGHRSGCVGPPTTAEAVGCERSDQRDRAESRWRVQIRYTSGNHRLRGQSAERLVDERPRAIDLVGPQPDVRVQGDGRRAVTQRDLHGLHAGPREDQ